MRVRLADLAEMSSDERDRVLGEFVAQAHAPRCTSPLPRSWNGNGSGPCWWPGFEGYPTTVSCLSASELVLRSALPALRVLTVVFGTGDGRGGYGVSQSTVLLACALFRWARRCNDAGPGESARLRVAETVARLGSAEALARFLDEAP